MVVVKKKYKKPSRNQYNYYRGGILGTCYKSEFFSSLDNKDDIHDLYFAPKFLRYKIMVDFGGQKREEFVTRSLADLSNEEMSDFITKVLGECNELGIEVLPSELFWLKYYNK